jgi:signal transduction histidine kinase
VFRFLTARGNQAAAARSTDMSRVVDMVRAAGLAIVLITVSIAKPHPAAGGRGLAVAVTLAVAAVAWIAWMLAGQRDRRLMVAALAAAGGAGGALAGLSPNSPAIAVGCMAAFSAGAYLSPDLSLGITAETVAAFLTVALATGAPTGTLLGYPFAYAGVWTMGLTRRAYRVRAEQAELMLTETRRAHEAETQAAALAERARIAREIHDVLAHSLAAVSVNLQAAEGLLGAGTLPAGNPELAKAVDCIGRAGALTREGLAAARRAVLALRDDAVPLPDQLSSLAEQYRAAGDLTVDFSVTGEARPLTAEASLAAYRTAQEALTNARKHSPGQPVGLILSYESGHITVTAVNPLPPEGTCGPLAATGAGYGLTGLRERAALVRGELKTGPADGMWQVALRIPA